MKASGSGWCEGRRLGGSSTIAEESVHEYPTAEAARGRHPGFPRSTVLAGGPGSLALTFGGAGGHADGEAQVDRRRARPEPPAAPAPPPESIDCLIWSEDTFHRTM